MSIQVKKPRKLLSQRHPLLYRLAVGLRRLQRKMVWWTDGKQYASRRDIELLPYRVKKHQSTLLRKLGDVDMQLQVNKVTNLRLALQHIDGILIRPGETFSFCKLVGLPTKAKGVKTGDTFFRKNEIWRKIIDKRTGNTISEECLAKNNARLSYVPGQYIVADDY